MPCYTAEIVAEDAIGSIPFLHFKSHLPSPYGHQAESTATNVVVGQNIAPLVTIPNEQISLCWDVHPCVFDRQM